jgi:hypothetical protein
MILTLPERPEAWLHQQTLALTPQAPIFLVLAITREPIRPGASPTLSKLDPLRMSATGIRRICSIYSVLCAIDWRCLWLFQRCTL